MTDWELRAQLRATLVGRAADRSRAYWTEARWTYWDLPVALVPAGYIEGVRLAGGLPLVLPPTPEGAREPGEVLDAIDGLLPDRRPRPRRRPLRLAAGASGDRPQAGAARRVRARAPASRRAGAVSRCSASAAACSCSTSPPAGTSYSTSPTRPISRRTALRPGCSDGIRSRSSRARGRPRSLGRAVEVHSAHHQGVGRRGGGARRRRSSARRSDRGGRGSRAAVLPRRAVAPRGGSRRAPGRRSSAALVEAARPLRRGATRGGRREGGRPPAP